jgi:lysophospholipase L1-like esterase
MPRVVLIGDSIRMNYQPHVQEGLVQAKVWGPNQNCETSRRILACFDDWISAHDPDVVHINCGLHDLRYNPDAEERVISPVEYAENIKKIMERLTCKTDSQIIWATITPVNERWHQERKLSRRYEADVALYNHLALETVSRYEVRVNDLFGAVISQGKDKILAEDGVHFTDEGYRLLSQQVVKVVGMVVDNRTSK